MAQLPDSVVDPVADAIFAHYKAKYGVEPQRPYLGASSIGKSCARALWYGFRWSKPPEFSGKLYRVFQSGHLQEPRVYADLTAIGCTVYDCNPATGKQWSWREPTNPHFRGNADGIITNLPQAKAPHILEIKTSSDKMFKVLQKDGVKQAKPEHYAQMQVYMKWSIDQFGKDGCHRALYLVVNKDNDSIYTERLEYSKEDAQALVDKALAIVQANEPPVGVSTDPTWYECKWCDYKDICHGTDVPEPTCRSCSHSTPEPDASWGCGLHKITLEEDNQRQGCNGHRYIPILLHKTGQPDDMDGTGVVYDAPGGRFTNGDPQENPAHISSEEIHACRDKVMLTDPLTIKLRIEHQGKFV